MIETNIVETIVATVTLGPAAGLRSESVVTESVIVSSKLQVAYTSEALSENLDHLREEFESASSTQYFTAATAVTTTSGLTVGYVLWALRSGWLASSILAQMPAWRLVDPLVVLSGLDGGTGSANDQSLQDMLRDGVNKKTEANNAKSV